MKKTEDGGRRTDSRGFIRQGCRMMHAGMRALPIAIAAVLLMAAPAARADNVVLTGGQCKLQPSTVTASGTIAAGSKYVECVFSADFVGSVNGLPYDGATAWVKTLKAPDGFTFPAIAYTRSAGSFQLTVIR